MDQNNTQDDFPNTERSWKRERHKDYPASDEKDMKTTLHLNKAETKTQKKTTLVRKYDGKENDMRTTLHLLNRHATDAG